MQESFLCQCDEACAELGFEGKHLIGLQGPFSRELNAAMLRQYDCRYLVTKDTGKAGGFQDKIDAALECDAVPVIIGRPLKEEGMSVRECKRFLTEHFQLSPQTAYYIAGNWNGKSKASYCPGEEQPGSGGSSDRCQEDGGFCETSGTGCVCGIQKPGDQGLY